MTTTRPRRVIAQIAGDGAGHLYALDEEGYLWRYDPGQLAWKFFVQLPEDLPEFSKPRA